MANWIIYGSNNVAKATVKELELHDEWMAECYITVSVKSATPISFAVGDYIDYRGERYTIQYDPNVIKKATSGSYGEGFTYDNIKFVGLQDEVVRCDFNDIVLNDNDIHYTALPTFPFYCESVDDLLDRIQANLEDLYPGQWIVIGLNTVRNSQRGTAVGRSQAFVNAYKQYVDPTGAAHTDPYGKQGVAETADNITCWDAMKKVHDDFDLNFIVRGRVIVVGTAGVFTANTFRYGKGNGLYELERIGESDQRIVTRLRAYGSEQNIPAHYYNTINKQVYATVTSTLHKFDTTGADFLLDLDFDRKYFTYRSESYPGTTEAPNYIIEMMANDVTVRGYVTKDATTGKCYVYCESVAGDDDRDEPDATKMAAFVQALTANDRLDFVEYVNKDAFGEGHYDYGTGHLPDNMAVSRLMLPGFPTMSLHAWVQAHKDDADKAWLAQAIADGFTFSNEVYRPYIDSPNKTQYGVRPGSIYFDGSDDTEDVHPTIEGMTYNGAPIDEVYAADQVEDNGVYPAGEEVKNIKITLPVLGFELDKVYEDGASIDMKNGMCGARSFKMAGTPKKDANGRWVCTVERVHDEALDLWFPYCDFQIHGSSEAGYDHGDKYVLTGIDMPDAYIDAAAVKLLQYSIEALKKNHAPRYTYQPRIDELWMQRQHDTASASQGGVSLHDTLKAGDIFAFADTDLNIDANIIIDVLTIRENGNNGIPTYEVTLRDEKQVGTIQKITNKVDSIVSGAVSINGATGGGLTARQIQSLIDRYGGEQFLSKLNDDTAQGYITMLQGLQIGASFVPDILGEGGVLRMRADGKVELVTDILYARMKAYFDTVEIREYQHTGGNRIASVAGNRMCRVEWYDANNQVLEQTQANLSSVAYFRCYFRASDGEDTVKNNWIVGDLAYCHITSIVNSSDNPEQKGLNQKHLWRLVIGRNTEGTLTEDGEAYIDLSNRATETISGASYTGYQSGSDIPEAQDDIIQLGNVNDTTRQGAIVEFVTGTDAPSYQIYQSINSFSLNNKNQIGFGYNTGTGKAYLRVLGDAYIGASDRSTFIEYKQDDGTQQHAPVLNIKAVMQTLPSSTYEGKSASQFVQDNQIKYDSAIQNLTNITNDLQSQIDGQVETFFYNGTPSDSVLPESEWKAIDIAAGNNNERLKHLSDLYYDNQTGYAYRYSNSGTEENPVFFWNPISDSAVIKALTDAAAAYGLANTKAKTFTTTSNTLPSPPYKTGDLWLNATGTWGSGDAAVTLNGDILKVKSNINRASGDTPLISDWELAGNYMNEQDFLDWKAGQYATDLTNAANNYLNDSVANAIKSALGSALGASTLTDGGLMLTSLIYLRKLNAGGDPTQVSDYTTWGGVSGEYDADAVGGGIAAWYGGNPVDKEVLQPDEPWDGTHHYRWARSLFRFDGSGYLADGNITWNENGALTIKNITTLSDSNNNNILNELATFNSAFTFGTSGQGSTTALYITPNVPFESLYIGTSNANKKEVATQEWVGNNYVSTAFFRQLFRAFKPNATAGQADVEVQPNTIDATISNIKAMVGFWTEQYVSALGNNSDGGGGGASVLYGLNDVTPNATGDGVMGAQDGYVLTYNGTTHHWYAAATAETYVLPQATADALGGIKIGYAASGKNYAIALDANGKAYVNVPWTDNNTWIPWAGATENAAGTAGYMPAPTSAQRTQFLRGDGTWVSLNNYSLPLAASGVRGGVQVGYTTDATNRNYAVQLSSEKMYVNVPWTDTVITDYWKTGDTRTANYVLAAPNGSNGAATFRALVAADIPNLGAGKITSGTFDAARIPDLSSTYAAVGRVDDLESYFTNGVANKAEELNTSRSLWGQSFNGTADVSGNMSSVGDISFSASGKKIGNFLYFDTTNTRLGVNTSSPSYRLHVDGTFYASGNSSIGGTFGVTGATTLTGLLTANGGIAIASSKTLKIGDIYLAYDSTNNAIEVYKLDGTNHVAANLYARGGIAALGETSDGGGGGQGDVTWALLADGTDTRQIALSHLTTALSTYVTQTWVGNNYLALSGGTLTGDLKINGTYNLYHTNIWDYGVIAGADGHDKVVLSYLASITNGAVVGGHNSTLTDWATLNICGTNLIFKIGEYEKMRIDSSGNVGIGTTSPAYELDVNGVIYTNNKISFPHGGPSYSWEKLSEAYNRTSIRAYCTAGETATGARDNYSIGLLIDGYYSFALAAYGGGADLAWRKNNGVWYDIITAENIGSQSVNYATSAGSCTGNAASATKLQNSRTIWGQSFDGTGNIEGTLQLNRESNSRGGLSFYSSSFYTWFFYMSPPSDTCPTGENAPSGSYVNSWALRSLIENLNGYGWTWESSANTSGANPSIMMELSSNTGNLKVAGTIYQGDNAVIHSGNIGNQSVNYATSAGSVAWGDVSSKPSNLFCYQGEVSTAYVNGTTYSTLDSGTYYQTVTGRVDSVLHFQFPNSSASGLDIKFAYDQNENSPLTYRKNIDSNRFASTSWVTLIDSLNIGSQSVNYATSAGSANSVAWTNVSSRPTKLSQFTNDSGFVTSSGVTSVATGTGLTGGTITSTGTISINSTYQTYISHGESAYNSLDNYLLKSGGTLTGNVTINGAANTETKLSLSGSQYTMDFLIGSGNVNRGIYDSTGNKWALYFDASNTIMNYGNVGIGTTSPSYKLHVSGTAYAENGYFYTITGASVIVGKTTTDCFSVMWGSDNTHGIYNNAKGYWLISTNASGNTWLDCGTTNVKGLTSSGDITTSQYLRVNAWTGYGSGSVQMWYNGSTKVLLINQSISSDGGVSCLSDARHKLVIRNTDLTVEQIANMPSVIFKWTDGKHDNNLHVGTLAQNWQQILPEVVLEGQDKEHTLSLSYGVAALVAAITTARKVVDHETRIKALEKENKELREEISRLKIA